MHHDDNETLNLLEKYKKNQSNEKTSGTFRTYRKNKNNGVPNLIWIGAIILASYIIIANVSSKVKERKVIKIETTHEISKPKINPIENIPNNNQKIIEATPIKPKEIVTQNIQRAEVQKQSTTIIITPTQKQEPVKKIEEIEEIKPGSSSGNIGYFR